MCFYPASVADWLGLTRVRVAPTFWAAWHGA